MFSVPVDGPLAITCIVLVGLWILYFVAACIVSFFTSQWWPRIDFRGKRVFITGGSTGIGLEMAKNFAARGAKVIISARREDVLQAAVAEINLYANLEHSRKFVKVLSAGYVTMDVSDESSVSAGIEQAMRIFSGGESGAPMATAETSESSTPLLKKRRNSVKKGSTTPRGTVGVSASPKVEGEHIDLLVCNAGYSYPSRLLDAPALEVKRQMEINFFGCVNVVRAALPSMFSYHEKNPAASPSRVVCISSLAAIVPAAGFTIYAPTKAALVAFCHSLDMESASKGVRAQVVYPPDVATPGFDKENLVKSEECKQICAFGGNAPFTAAEMGKAIVDSLEGGGGFSITLGLDGWLLSRLGSMMQPGTFVSQVLDVMGVSSVARLVGCVFAKIHYSIVAGVTTRERRRGQ